MNQLQIHAKRRQQLAKAMVSHSAAIIVAAPALLRNRDTEHVYRQNSDFHYLTGFPEPEAVAVVVRDGSAKPRLIMFCRERNPEREIWDGKREGQDGARKHFGADEAYSIDQIENVLPRLLENRQAVYWDYGARQEWDEKVSGWCNVVKAKVRIGVSAPTHFFSLDALVHAQRLHKDPHEIALMRRAARISAQAHRRAMQQCQAGMAEYEIEAELLYEFTRFGSRAPAYPSIVAGGENACVLHYRENNATLQDGDLLLIDAGCEIDHYASDITRTFPVSGTFTPAQRSIYELVLKAQYAAIAKVKPGKRWNEPHDTAVRVLTQGLVKLGLLNGPLNKLIKDGAYRRFYMHRTGHWLGMDVHDVGDYRVDNKWRRLEPGMVLTVEPGLYIAPRSKDVDKQWWGIGVRIEDDVLVTRTGNDVLSDFVPKNVPEIEALMAYGARQRAGL